MIYKVLPNTQRPIPTLLVSSKEFVNEWQLCWEDKNHDMSYLLKIAEPLIEHWIQLLTNPNYPKDVNLISLYSLLEDEFNEAESLIEKWLNYVENTTSIREELTFIFIERVRKCNYYPYQASPMMAEYIIARDFKLRLKDIIISKIKEEYIFLVDKVDPEKLFYNPHIPDYLEIKHLALMKWDEYLFDLLVTNSQYEIADLIHIPRDSIKRECYYVWHYLRRIYLPTLE